MTLELTKKAKSQLKKLPKREANKVARKLLSLEASPFSGKKLEGRLQEYYTLRAWPYRILYVVDRKQKVVTVDTIEHRQGVYK